MTYFVLLAFAGKGYRYIATCRKARITIGDMRKRIRCLGDSTLQRSPGTIRVCLVARESERELSRLVLIFEVGITLYRKKRLTDFLILSPRSIPFLSSFKDFAPTGLLSRDAVAKILCHVILTQNL